MSSCQSSPNTSEKYTSRSTLTFIGIRGHSFPCQYSNAEFSVPWFTILHHTIHVRCLIYKMEPWNKAILIGAAQQLILPVWLRLCPSLFSYTSPSLPLNSAFTLPSGFHYKWVLAGQKLHFLLLYSIIKLKSLSFQHLCVCDQYLWTTCLCVSHLNFVSGRLKLRCLSLNYGLLNTSDVRLFFFLWPS